jgi:hypothetical protein
MHPTSLGNKSTCQGSNYGSEPSSFEPGKVDAIFKEMGMTERWKKFVPSWFSSSRRHFSSSCCASSGHPAALCLRRLILAIQQGVPWHLALTSQIYPFLLTSNPTTSRDLEKFKLPNLQFSEHINLFIASFVLCLIEHEISFCRCMWMILKDLHIKCSMKCSDWQCKWQKS